jgi:hypothetical protein
MVLHRIDALAISSNYTVLSTKKKRNVYVPEKKEMEDTLRTI